MSNVLENVRIESDRVYKEAVYIKKQDFPINIGREMIIRRGHISRQFFQSKKPVCMSWDGEIGKTAASGYKDEKICKECPYLKGVPISTGSDDKIKCQQKYTIYMDHQDPEKEYVLTLGVGAWKNLDIYSRSLATRGLDANQVVTKITRVENINSNGSTYLFEFVRELEITLSETEKAALNKIRAKAATNPISVSLAKDILMKLEDLDGITPERALRLAESISTDGIICG